MLYLQKTSNYTSYENGEEGEEKAKAEEAAAAAGAGMKKPPLKRKLSIMGTFG